MPRGNFIRVAPHLYRERRLNAKKEWVAKETGIYWATAKIDGKARWHSLETRDFGQAKVRLDKWISTFGTEKNLENYDMRVGALLDKFLSVRKPGTAKNDRWISGLFRKYYKPGLQQFVREVVTSDLMGWMKIFEEEKVEGKVVRRARPDAQRIARGFIRKMFETAVADKVISESPYKAELITAAGKNRIRRRYPTEAQFNNLITTIRETVFNSHCIDSADFAEFAGLAGLGQAEIAPMQWKHIWWEDRLPDHGGEQIQAFRKKTKTPFVIPLFPWVRPLLERRLASAKKTREYSLDSYVFDGLKDPKKAVSGACEKLFEDRKKFSLRDLRGMRIKILYRAGVDVKTLSQWQGHTDGGTLILRTYSEAFSDDDLAHGKEAVDKATAAWLTSQKIELFDVVIVGNGSSVLFKSGVSKDEAEALRAQLAAMGAQVEVRAAA